MSTYRALTLSGALDAPDGTSVAAVSARASGSTPLATHNLCMRKIYVDHLGDVGELLSNLHEAWGADPITALPGRAADDPRGTQK